MAELPLLWVTAGLSCDGDSIALTAATQPSLEDLVLGRLPGVPKLRLYHPTLALEVGDAFLEVFRLAAAGELEHFVLVVEGSIPDEERSGDGCFAGLGTDHATGQPIPTTRWVSELAARADVVVAMGSCAAYGGIHAMLGNPTGAMGLEDHLGRGWRSRLGVPIVNLGGCPVRPDNITETLLYLLRMSAGTVPTIPLDDIGRPAWLFSQTLHESCDRGGYYEQGDFATAYGSPRCIVKLGCWGPVTECNVGKHGWMGGVGGCANVGGVCIGCTMPGFPDRFLPFLDEPPGAKMSSSAVLLYGRTVRALRNVTRASLRIEPEWRGPKRP